MWEFDWASLLLGCGFGATALAVVLNFINDITSMKAKKKENLAEADANTILITLRLDNNEDDVEAAKRVAKSCASIGIGAVRVDYKSEQAKE